MPTILLNNIRPGGKYLKNLKINSTEIKYVKRGDGKLFYDTLKDTTYSDITITSFLYAIGIVPASGGSTSAPSYAYSQKITPVGYASSYSSSTVTSGASVSFSKVSGDGATVNSTTGVVTFSSRGTTYSASLRSAVVKITISLNGKTSTKEVTCYLSANLITDVTANSNVFSYANISASATSATPSTSHTPIFTFSSTSTSATIPSSTYGSLTTTCSYSIANTTTNGFTACNSSTGVLTATARGTTIGNARTSATVTKTLKYTWTPASGYGSAVNSGNLTKTATCTQNGNYVTAVTCTANTLSYAAIGAGATSSGTPTYNFGNAKFTYSSGSSAEGAPSSTYGTYSSSVKFTIANTTTNGFKGINASTGVLTSTSRGTIIGNARSSATVTCTLTMTWTPTSSYNAEGTKSGTKTATATCTLNGNYVTAVTPKASTGYSTHASYASNISAAGGTVSPTNHGLATYTFSSGGTITDGSTSWTTAGTTTYTRTYSATLATGFTSVTTAGAVTASGRGKTSGNARSQTVSAKLTVKFVHSSTYSAGGTKEGSVTHSITCTLNHNNPSTVYNAPTIASATSSDIPASGGTFAKSWLTVKYNQTAYYDYPSGSDTSTSPHSVASNATATQAMISFTGTAPTGSNLGSTAYSRTSKGSVTVIVTANSKTSSGKSVTVYQQANTKTNTCTSLTIGTFSYATFSGTATETKSPTVSNVTATGTISYTSGDTESYTNSVVTGSISKYYVINSTTYFTIDAYSGAVTTKSVNSGTAERKATVTLSASYGGKTTSKTATVTQSVASTTYNLAWKFSVFNVTNTIHSFGFKFTNSVSNLLTLTGGGGSGGTSNPSREGTSSIRSDISTSVFRPNGFYFTNMNSTYSIANNSSGCYLDGSTGKYYYVRWAYGKAPTTSNYKTHGYKFYSEIVESWTYSASTLYVWVYQA